MATYAIGDLQGCLTPLLALLQQIEFQPNKDELWFAGDLVNRGPDSLATLRFVHALGENAKVVLGNHDLHLLAVAHGHGRLKRSDTLTDILNASDRDTLLGWLQQQPLCHYDVKFNTIMTHAGIPPCWTLEQTLTLATEVQKTLRSPQADEFFAVMYGNKPEKWHDKLVGMERIRAIVNYLTRMRFCTKRGKLDLKSKGASSALSEKYAPWFQHPSQLPADCHIVFGHWASLEGRADNNQTHALDTGCVWGGRLTALRLDDMQRFSTPCPTTRTPK